MMPPSYPIKTLILVLAASFLVIGTAQASYQQVYITSTVQASNLTENSTTSTSYVTLKPLTVPANISGNFTISFELRQWAEGTGYGRIYKNNVAYGTEQTDVSGTYTAKTELFTGYLNTTDVLEIRAKTSTVAATTYVKNVELRYDNVAAPTITSPVNNSAQTSRTVNITTNTNNIQYQVSQASDFSTLLYNAFPSSDSFSGDLTFPTGLNYIRVRGYNSTEDSITNWTTSIVYISDSSVFHGGTGYVWGANGTFINATPAKDTNVIYGSTSYINGWSDNNCSGLWVTNGVYGCSGGNLWMNHTSNQFLTINETNFANTQVFLEWTRTWGSANNPANGIILRSDTASQFPMASSIRRETLRKQQTWTDSSTAIDMTSSVAETYEADGVTNYMRYSANGTTYASKSWNSSVSEPGWDAEKNTTYSLSSGSIGVKQSGGNITISTVYSNPIYSDGTPVTTSYYTTNLFHIGNSTSYKFVSSYVVMASTGITNISLYYNASADNLTYTGWMYVGTMSSTGTHIFQIPNDPLYVQLKYELNASIISENVIVKPRLYNYSLGTRTLNSVSGYVNYPNGTGIPGATVGYFDYWTTTNSLGAYELVNITIGNTTIASGFSGYYPSAEIVAVNDTLNTTLNFTLIEAPVFISNKLMDEAEELSQIFLPAFNATGIYNSSYFYYDTLDEPYALTPERMPLVLSVVVSQGKNVTPQYYERLITIMERINYKLAQNTTLRYDDYPLQDGTQYVQLSEWLMFFQTTAYDEIISIMPDNLSSRFNDTLIAFDYSNYRSFSGSYREYLPEDDQVFNASVEMDNHALFEAIAEQIRIKYNLTSNTSYRNAIISKHLSQASGKNGYVIGGETSLTTSYNLLEVRQMLMLEQYGYIGDSAWNQTLSDGKNWSTGIFLNDGEAINQGRGIGGISSVAGNVLLGILMNEYRIADLSYYKMNEARGDLYDSYFLPRNYFNYSYSSGLVGYIGWSGANLNSAFWLALAGKFYDSSMIENNYNVNSFNDTNNSGILKLSKNGYAVWSNTKVDSRVSSQVGSETLPFRFMATVENAEHLQFSTNPENINIYPLTSDTDYTNMSRSVIIFNEGSVITDLTTVNSSNVTSGIDSDSYFINWTDVSTSSGMLDFLNLTVTQVEDRLNISYIFYGSGLDNYSIPIYFIMDDNRTSATWDTSGCPSACLFNFTRGNESVNFTNVSGTNVNISLNTTYGGYGFFGYSNATLISGDTDGGLGTLSFDVKISTNNVYGYSLNQPPNIYSYSPETPLTTGLYNSQQFSVVLTQNNINVSWQINGTEVQQNNTIASGITSYYTNSSLVAGLWNLSAIGCNAQGCAMQTWEWSVVEPFISKLIRRLIIID